MIFVDGRDVNYRIEVVAVLCCVVFCEDFVVVDRVSFDWVFVRVVSYFEFIFFRFLCRGSCDYGFW